MQDDTQEMQIAHVLFMDIVSYSTLPMDRQTACVRQVNEIVASTESFTKAKAKAQLITLATGDGMALAFLGGPEQALRCAIEVAAAIKRCAGPRLRLGLHSGPVFRVTDIGGHENIAGGGINYAQRVMDCGDGGHILLSSSIAEMLLENSRWAPHVNDLGVATVKHGVKLHLYSYCDEEVGSADLPEKLKNAAAPPQPPQKKQSAASHSAADLTRLEQRLATFVGPIASILVEREAPRHATLEQLYLAVAANIRSPKDRNNFLLSRFS